MIEGFSHYYNVHMSVLYPDRTTPPDAYGKYLQNKKRKKYKPRNKGRK